MHLQQPKHHQYGQTLTEDTGPENQVFEDISEGVVRRATAETTRMATDNTASRVVPEHTRGQHKIHAGQLRRVKRTTHIQGF